MRPTPAGEQPAPGLTLDDFWATIASLPPETPLHAMVDALRLLSPAQRHDLAHHLAASVAAIDTPAHRDEVAHARETSLVADPDLVRAPARPGDPALPLEVQLTVVALGRDAWRAVVDAPAVLRGAWPTQLGRKLAHAFTLAHSLDTLDGPLETPADPPASHS